MEEKMFSPDGYIIDQRCAACEPYGTRMSDVNGCGWMAAYNVLRAAGISADADKVRAALETGLHFGGHLGTGPLRLVRYLRACGVPVQLTLRRKTAQQRAQQCRAGAVLYWTGRAAHFAAFVPAQSAEDLPPAPPASLRFFNAVCGDAHHCATLPQFLARHCRGHAALVVTVPRAPLQN
ncbi:MAG: hypothetical protein RSA17_10140 [Ruthenibacterium sp.]